MNVLQGIVQAVSHMAGRIGVAWITVPFALLLSLAQRTLSTGVRFARRSAGNASSARSAELALQLLAAALPALAGALLLARSG